MTFILPSFGASAISAVPSGGGGASAWNNNSYALAFDGTDDYLSLGNLGTAGRSLGAMLMWVNVTSTNGIHSNSIYGYLFGFGDGTSTQQWNGLNWGYVSGNTDLLSFAALNSSARTRFQAPSAGDKLTSGWHLIGVNHDGSKYDIIIDGVTAPNATLDSENSGSYHVNHYATSIISGTNFDNVMVARNHFLNRSPTQGLIDEVAIWDSALSSSDLTTIYNSGVPRDISTIGNSGNGPNVWYRMGDTGSDNGTSTITNAANPGTNDATIANATSGTNTSGATFHDLSTGPDSIYVA